MARHEAPQPSEEVQQWSETFEQLSRIDWLARARQADTASEMIASLVIHARFSRLESEIKQLESDFDQSIK